MTFTNSTRSILRAMISFEFVCAVSKPDSREGLMKSMHLMPVVMAFFMMLQASTALGQEDSSKQADETAKKIQQHWLKVSETYAKSFSVAEAREDAKPFQWQNKPIFLHTQSVRGDDIGAVHLWLTADKRPAAVGAVFAWSNSKTSRMVSYEFHSLVEEPIALVISGKRQWTSRTKGIEWKPLPEGTPLPAEKTLRQRLQVKQLARRFTANSTSDKDQRWELRLVPTPIFEYQSESAGIVHGAMFAFCQGTDTELLLLIEAVRKAKDQKTLTWRYGLVPFTDYKVRAALGDEEIWESPAGRLGQDGNPHYWNFLEQAPKPEFEIAQD